MTILRCLHFLHLFVKAVRLVVLDRPAVIEIIHLRAHFTALTFTVARKLESHELLTKKTLGFTSKYVKVVTLTIIKQGKHFLKNCFLRRLTYVIDYKLVYFGCGLFTYL